MNKIWLLSLLAISIIHARNSITVIGIGKLGLCTALCFEQAGYDVLGIDLNQEYIASLNNKTFNSLEPHVNTLLHNSTRFTASCSLDEGLEFSDIYYIMVDTPSTPHKEAYDHKNLNNVLSEINKRKVTNKHIVIGCTVFPGYIRTIGKNLLKDCINTTLSYNPEFIAQGNIIHGLQHPDIVLIGEGSPEAGDTIEALYQKTCLNKPRICRMSPDSAEITKLAVNCFITTKIAYANMVADIADKTPDADKYAILNAIGGDNRIGHLCLKPGYGFGGPCFPRDNRALGSYAQTLGIDPVIPQATDSANKLHAHFMTKQFLDKHQETYIFEKVTYKNACNVPIIDESQKLVVAAALAQKGKKVVIIDTEPVIKEVQKVFGDMFEYQLEI
ncbi:MAG: nucleotide sugar dehydrogenase [Candidatus Babeliaceae bacterium]|jgi:nucleotide sugar dehydrogenase